LRDRGRSILHHHCRGAGRGRGAGRARDRRATPGRSSAHRRRGGPQRALVGIGRNRCLHWRPNGRTIEHVGPGRR
jgi:hypothetical protein